MICFDYGQPDRTTVDGVTVFKCHRADEGLPCVRFFHPRLTGLWSALRRANADIYYQRAAAGITGVTALFARRYGRKFIYAAAHDLDLDRAQTWKLFQRRGGWRDRQLFQLGLKLADEVVAQHGRQVEDCERSQGRVATLVPSCYSPQSSQAADLKDVVLWVSTLRSWKRPELFLNLANRLPHLRFRMVGGPALGEESLFRRMQEMAAMMPNVEFVGFVPFAEIDPHFNAARVFVNTSDYEGFPNTFLQAWSRGIPTVSFHNTGSTVDGETVINVASDLDEMASLIARLTEDDGYWAKAGDRVRRCYETFHTPEAAIDAYARVFESHFKPVVNPRGARRLPGLKTASTARGRVA
jgi:glycosyltransferase involved in cell wall biosynthesis